MNSENGKILIVDDDVDILTAGKLLLKRHYGQVFTCEKPELIEEVMSQHHFDAILLDMNFGPGESSGEQGFFWLAKILAIDPQAVVVLITAHGGVDVAVEAMKMGATDFISKPWQNEKLVATLSASVKLSRSRVEAASLKKANRALSEFTGVPKQPMLGNSPAMQNALSLIARAAPTDANVLLLGENGTGKELAARAIWQQSMRSGEIFMTVDLGAVSETLFESELFGHTKGAFTDAREDRTGRIEAANGGTLFLDEIGNLPLHLQVKLLSVLEQRKVSPLGSNQVNEVNVRVIAATNLPRHQLADEKRFRQDLLFRLNTVEITVPPLRDRRTDIPVLAEHYAELYGRKYGRGKIKISQESMQALVEYDWPGNVRALRHALERAVILSSTDTLQAADFQLEVQPVHPGTFSRSAISSSFDPITQETQAAENKGLDYGEQDLNLERIEKRTIEAALKHHRYNISHAAKELGLTRAALYRRMEKHGL